MSLIFCPLLSHQAPTGNFTVTYMALVNLGRSQNKTDKHESVREIWEEGGKGRRSRSGREVGD